MRDPAALALAGTSVAAAGLLAYASAWAVAILRRWDPASGSAGQLALERRTFLVSTIVGHVLAFQVAALFFHVLVADRLAPQITGAMCAAGVLAANPFGYPALLLELAGAVLAGAWLVLDHADARGWDHPLLRRKYALLLALTPIAIAGTVLQVAHLAALDPAVITSCCGSLFDAGGESFGADLAGIPGRPAAAVLYVTAGGAALAGAAAPRVRRAAPVLGLLAATALPATIAAVIAWVSPYAYELPGHHCPFCLLRAEYGRVGWPLWAALLAGVIAGAGAGLMHPLRRIPSLAAVAPRLERRLAAAAAIAFVVVLAIATWLVAASALRA